MNMQIILNNINLAPTLMSVDQEIEYINKLRQLKNDHIAQDINTFISILERLCESHSLDGYLEVTQENKSTFLGLADWLNELAVKDDRFVSYSEDLNAFSNVFRILPWEVYSES